MIAEVGFDFLLQDLYGSLTAPERLPSFLSRLGDATGCHIGGFLRQDLRQPSLVTSRLVGVSECEAAGYIAEVGSDNPWIERAKPFTKTGAVLFGEDRATLGEIKTTRYYQGFLRHIDIAYSVGVCAELSRSNVTFMTFCRSERMGAFDAESRALYGRLSPHFVNAYATLTQIEHLRAQATLANRRTRAMFLLDDGLRWIGGNESAEWMVAQGWWRGRHGTRLEAGHAAGRIAWTATMRELEQGHLLSRVVPVYDRSGALAAFAGVHAHGAAGGEGLPSYVLFVRPLQSDDDADIALQLRTLFGLTEGEATLAVALRRHGELSEAASSLKITPGGARTRLQTVFDKTGTHRQVDLLRMLDALVDAIA